MWTVVNIKALLVLVFAILHQRVNCSHNKHKVWLCQWFQQLHTPGRSGAAHLAPPTPCLCVIWTEIINKITEICTSLHWSSNHSQFEVVWQELEITCTDVRISSLPALPVPAQTLLSALQPCSDLYLPGSAGQHPAGTGWRDPRVSGELCASPFLPQSTWTAALLTCSSPTSCSLLCCRWQAKRVCCFTQSQTNLLHSKATKGHEINDTKLQKFTLRMCSGYLTRLRSCVCCRNNRGHTWAGDAFMDLNLCPLTPDLFIYLFMYFSYKYHVSLPEKHRVFPSATPLRVTHWLRVCSHTGGASLSPERRLQLAQTFTLGTGVRPRKWGAGFKLAAGAPGTEQWPGGRSLSWEDTKRRSVLRSMEMRRDHFPSLEILGRHSH